MICSHASAWECTRIAGADAPSSRGSRPGLFGEQALQGNRFPARLGNGPYRWTVVCRGRSPNGPINSRFGGFVAALLNPPYESTEGSVRVLGVCFFIRRSMFNVRCWTFIFIILPRFHAPAWKCIRIALADAPSSRGFRPVWETGR